MKLVVATGNRDKLEEMNTLLHRAGGELIPISVWPGFIAPEETGLTLDENARLKASAAARYTGLPAIADDTGLEVDALGGRPGVLAARYAGEEASYRDNRLKLLAELQGVPEIRRGAVFRTVAALCFPEGECHTVEGACSGRITLEERGSGGFGYDSVFLIPSLGMTFAEMPLDQKNSLSHRSEALRRMRELILALISRGKMEG